MEKGKFERFVSKYNLGGSCESVVVKSTGKDLSVRSVSDDKNIVAEVTLGDFNFPQGEFPVYETKRLKSLLGVLDDTLTVSANSKGGKVVGVDFKDASTKVTFVLAEAAVIPKVPDLKAKLPPFEVILDLNEQFITSFVKAKGALAEVGSFTVFSDGDKDTASVVLGYSSTVNTNRVQITATASSNAKLDPISFSANYMREILLANKDLKNGKLHISSKGLSLAEFSGDNFTTKYYLVKVDVKD